MPCHSRCTRTLRLLLAGGLALAAGNAPATAPPPPGPTAASCDATVAGKCYVTGRFTVTSSSPGADHYRVCRSHDTGGWGGCNVVIAHDTQVPFTVAGADLPSDGLRRAYYVSSCDAGGACTPWKDNDEAYVERDVSPPVAGSATVSSPAWRVDRTETYEIVAAATDAGSGVGEIRALINLWGSNSANRRGHFSWRDESLGYAFAKNRVSCAGGGLASMHPSNHGATRVTLESCATTLTGDERRVTFTLRPNESFGVFDPVNDVATRAWDLVGNASGWTQFDLNFSSFRPDDAPGERIGYQGILDGAGLDQADAEGIGVNLATLLLQRRTCAPFYWQTVDSAAILADFAARNVHAMVILENFLFKDVNSTAVYHDDCDDPTPAPPPEPTPCGNGALWRRLPDWQARLDAFDALHGAAMNPQDVALFLISSEVNDRCFDLAEVEEVAGEVKSRYPAIPVGFLYGATYNRLGERLSEPPPAFFPAVFDIVGLFSYDNFDVADPLEPRNATGSYYNPEEPTDPSTIYGDLLAKLHPHQEVLLVFDADYSGGPDPCVDPQGDPQSGNAAQGWCAADLGEVAENYAEFMTYRPEVTMLGGFTWQSLLTLPQSVRDRAAAMVCDAFDNDSWLCE